MKNKRLLLLSLMTLICFTQATCADDHDTLFQQANNLYKEGNYEQALNAYKNIQNKSNLVHYNIGNCHYKLQQQGKALAAWRRAEHNWGWSEREELTKNIALVKSQLHREEESISKFRLAAQSLYNRIKSFIRATPLLWIQLLVLIIWLFLFIYLAYLRKKRKKVMISCLFFLLATAAGLLAFKYSQQLLKKGIIITQQIPVRSGPGETYQQLTTLYEGKEVRIRKQVDDHYKISFPGSIGWIPTSSLEEI
jgi:tetratricopeptide (TPR) repeat protein